MPAKPRKKTIRWSHWKETSRRDLNTIEVSQGSNGAFGAYLLTEVTEICTVSAPGCDSIIDHRIRYEKGRRIDIRDHELFMASGGTSGTIIRMAGVAVEGIVHLVNLQTKMEEEAKGKAKTRKKTRTAR